MNAEEIRNVMLVLHGAWPRTEIDEATVAVWSNSLATVDYGLAQQALARLIGTMTYFPSVADFNGEITRLKYRVKVEQEMKTPALPPPTQVQYKKGIELAVEAYEKECEEQGRAPNPEIVRRWLSVARTI